jgi:hypothetical protein
MISYLYINYKYILSLTIYTSHFVIYAFKLNFNSTLPDCSLRKKNSLIVNELSSW